MKKEHYLKVIVAGLAICLAIPAVLTAVIDPCFHYHKPLANMSYTYGAERYVNDGITRNFDYNAIITGTSVTENFKTSDMESIFGVSAIKVPFAAAYLNEVDANLRKGLETHDVEMVVRAIDFVNIMQDKDSAPRKDIVPPEYLIDSNPFNDVSYLFNKEIFVNYTLENLIYTLKGEATTTFDEYASWDAEAVYGREQLVKYCARAEIVEEERVFTEEERQTLVASLEQNVLEAAREHPETTFYLFFPPYSICYWDGIERENALNWHREMERTVIETLLQCDNIKLYSFNENTELISNLDNYRDTTHYSGAVNSEILAWMSEDAGRLTEENYEQYLESCYDYYANYDYDSIYEGFENEYE